MNTKSKIAALSAAAVASFGLGTAVAQADTVTVTGGETDLNLNKKADAALKDLGLTADGTAFEVKKGEYDFAPIDDGGGGVLKHKGALTISGDDGKVKLKSFGVDVFGDEGTQPDPKVQGVLTAKVGGEQIDVADLSTKHYESSEDDLTFSGLTVKLTDDAATALNDAFDTDAFEAGLKIGTLSNESETK